MRMFLLLPLGERSELAEIMLSSDSAFVSVCTQRTGQSDSWGVNANSSETVKKATNFKFDTRIFRDSPDTTP